MSKVNFITIKNKYNGFTRSLGEPEFNGMIDKADYEVVISKKSVDPGPNSSWTNVKIQAYLDDMGVKYSATDNKATLLSLVGT